MIKHTLKWAGQDKRSVITHSQFQKPQQLPKYVETGTTPPYFTNHVFYWGDVHIRNVGEEKASFISPIKAGLGREDFVVEPGLVRLATDTGPHLLGSSVSYRVCTKLRICRLAVNSHAAKRNLGVGAF